MKNTLLLPVLIGVAAAGALAYFLIAEDTAELRESLLEKLADSFADLKNKALEKVKI